MILLFFLLFFLFSQSIYCVIVDLKSSTPFDIQLDAARGLIQRVLKNSTLANAFVVEQLFNNAEITQFNDDDENQDSESNENVYDTFEISNVDEKHKDCKQEHCMLIRGTSGVALSSGFYW